MKREPRQVKAECESRMEGDRLTFIFSGSLQADGIESLWIRVDRALRNQAVQVVDIEGSRITSCDGAGAALLVYIRNRAQQLGASFVIHGFKQELSMLLDLYREPAEKTTTPPKKHDLIVEIGRAFSQAMRGVQEHISFLGELGVAIARSILRPVGIRVRDFMVIVENCGARALPIIAMLGFLVGLIMAFQGAVLMTQFGAEIYIADFVGKSVVRELGPLITAIIVAGRTGSAFAAEIGTMKVNEEIDALSTMGLDPVRFLVVPRVIAATLMTPLLAIMTNLFGMAGGAVVMKGLGFPLVTYVNRVLAIVTTTDFVSGLVKALVFGLLIASAGCLCGLRTGGDAQAVGRSTTRAVVSSITMIVIADGIFAVLFYFMGV